MDIQPQSTQPISDDQELAKVLAGVNAEEDEAAAGVPAPSDVVPPVAPGEPPVAAPTAAAATVTTSAYAPDPVVPAPVPPVSVPVAGELDGVKSQAISELRPLVDKLTLPPEEKFDTYLLLIRSTDDKSLIAPAHEAAKEITDESRRAQALLDIIKEIDFLSGQQPAA
jgi:hypothetical protein